RLHAAIHCEQEFDALSSRGHRARRLNQSGKRLLLQSLAFETSATRSARLRRQPRSTPQTSAGERLVTAKAGRARRQSIRLQATPAPRRLATPANACATSPRAQRLVFSPLLRSYPVSNILQTPVAQE